mgnify:CR=1 FL=1
MHQLSLWTLLPQPDPQPNPHRLLQRRLPAALTGWELWRIDYAPKGYRALYQPLSIFTELHPTVEAAIDQAYAIGFLTETLPESDLELMFASFGRVLPGHLPRPFISLEQTSPAFFTGPPP